MCSRSPGRKLSGGSAPTSPQRCQLLLDRCIAITLRRICGVPVDADAAQSRHSTDLDMECANDVWMFDNGYLLFQGFVQANSRCFWNVPLLEAMRLLQFQGYVAPGVLLVRAGVCALEVMRNAWSRRVLKAPNNYIITSLGDVEECIVSPAPQSHFTPLAEALCWVILELTASGQAAALPAILRALPSAFPNIARPDTSIVYDALAKLGSEQKVYQTARGYFVVTPETRRRRLSSGRRRMPSQTVNGSCAVLEDGEVFDDNTVARTTKATVAAVNSRKSMLMSSDEAVVFVYGDMHTIRDGAVTHQCVQTNLADVLCGGNPNDKVVYARNPSPRRSTSMPLERRHSLRLLSSRRSSTSLQRCGSVRLLRSETSSLSASEERGDTKTDKKGSLLMRLFRRARRRGQSAPPAPLHGVGTDAETGVGADGLLTFSAQFPPTEWFNNGVADRMSVGTQTESPPSLSGTPRQARSRLPDHLPGWPFDAGDHMDASPSRPSTLPRRHRRRDSLACHSAAEGSPTPRTNRRYKSPASCSPATLSRCTSRNSLSPEGSTLPSYHKPPPGKGSTIPLTSCLPPTGLPPITYATSTDLLKVPSSKQGSKGFRSASSHRSVSGMSKSSSGYNSSAGTSLRSTPSFSPTNKIVPSEPKVMRCFGKPIQSLPVPKSNSVTLQVSTTNRSPQSNGHDPKPSKEKFESTSSASETTTTTTTTTTINGVNNTKIYVQQHNNSPVHSVITFENKTSQRRAEQEASITNGNPQTQENPTEPNSPGERSKFERPNSLCSPRELVKSGFGNSKARTSRGEFLETSFDKNSPSVEALTKEVCQGQDSIRFSNHKINNHNVNIKRVSSTSSFESLTSAGSLVNSSKEQEYLVGKITEDVVEMNNSRQAPVVMTAFPKIKESLSYKNILKEVLSTGPDSSLRDSFKNLANPPPTKVSFGNSLGEEKGTKLPSMDSLDNNVEAHTDSELVSSTKAPLKEDLTSKELYPFASLSDLSMHFKSVTAQKILSGVSINSIDTMVEVNLASAEKKNNCDVTIHTDFGLV